MIAAILPFLKLQMITGLFKGGGRGGFNIGKLINMMMMMTLIPTVLGSLGGLG